MNHHKHLLLATTYFLGTLHTLIFGPKAKLCRLVPVGLALIGFAMFSLDYSFAGPAEFYTLLCFGAILAVIGYTFMWINYKRAKAIDPGDPPKNV